MDFPLYQIVHQTQPNQIYVQQIMVAYSIVIMQLKKQINDINLVPICMLVMYNKKPNKKRFIQIISKLHGECRRIQINQLYNRDGDVNNAINLRMINRLINYKDDISQFCLMVAFSGLSSEILINHQVQNIVDMNQSQYQIIILLIIPQIMQPRKFILQNNSRSLAIRDRVQSTRNQFSKSDIKKLVKSYFNNQKQINKKSLPSLNQNNQFPKTGAKAVFVYDYDRKVDLYKNNQYEKRQIASLTKIMTCWVAIQYIRTYDIIPEQFFVTVSNKASIMNGTTSQLQDGDKLSLWDLLHGLMLPSGNDAAICIAQVLGGKLDHGKKSKIENFVQEMNLWANHFEMKNTNYANPHGLANRNNKSTAQDQMILIRNAIEDPLFARIIDKRVYFCSVQEKDGWTRQLFWENTNRLLYRGFSGVKTGSTVPAGYCLASWYKNQNVNLLVVVLGCNSDQNRYEDTIKIIKWGIKQHSARQSLKSSHVTSLQ